MANVVSDIILTPAKIYKSALGTTAPADSVAADGAWPAGWTLLGWQETPLSASYTWEELESDIQESLAPVKRFKTKEELVLETTLKELDMTQLGLAWNGTVTPTAASSGVYGKDELTMGGSAAMTEYQFGIEGKYVDEDGATFPIRMLIWKATASAGGKLEFGKSATTGIPLKIKALADMSKTDGQRLFKMIKILEPAGA